MNIVSKWITLSTMIVLSSAAICYSSTEVVRASKTRTAAYPKIEIYTSPGCKSCSAASKYLTSNNIPFTTKDISQNSDYQEELAQRYKTRAVPVIVIGNDEKVLRGYVQEAFQQAVREVMLKQR